MNVKSEAVLKGAIYKTKSDDAECVKFVRLIIQYFLLIQFNLLNIPFNQRLLRSHQKTKRTKLSVDHHLHGQSAEFLEANSLEVPYLKFSRICFNSPDPCS